MKEKTYLIFLTGFGGDIDIRLVNKESFDYVVNGGVASQEIIDRWMEETCEDEEEAARVFAIDANERSSSPDNDRAFSVFATKYNGESYEAYNFDFDEITKFINKHNLELADTFKGMIY